MQCAFCAKTVSLTTFVQVQDTDTITYTVCNYPCLHGLSQAWQTTLTVVAIHHAGETIGHVVTPSPLETIPAETMVAPCGYCGRVCGRETRQGFDDHDTYTLCSDQCYSAFQGTFQTTLTPGTPEHEAQAWTQAFYARVDAETATQTLEPTLPWLSDGSKRLALVKERTAEREAYLDASDYDACPQSENVLEFFWLLLAFVAGSLPFAVFCYAVGCFCL